jgi:type II secretory pathway component PulJ
MKTRKDRRGGGLILIEFLVVLGLMAAFVVVATRLFRLSMNTTTAAAKQQEDSLRLEQATHALRADVWHAKRIELPDADHLHLSGDRLDVTWTTKPELARSEDDQRQAWRGLHLRFERQGPWVVVKRGGAEVALLRQLEGGAR